MEFCGWQTSVEKTSSEKQTKEERVLVQVCKCPSEENRVKEEKTKQIERASERERERERETLS